MDSKVEKISDMEAEIMRVVWSRGRSTTYKEIREDLNEKYNIGSQSIQTMIKRLVHKEILKQEKQDVYYYTALVSESEYVKSKTITFVKKVFGGDTKCLLNALASYREISPEDFNDLQEFWEKGGETDE